PWYAISNDTARYGQYVPVRVDTGTRTARYRAVHVFWLVPRRTDWYRGVPTSIEAYRLVPPQISTVTEIYRS
ncbi:unnamed protein product, partial [Musa textilis]